MTTEEECWKKTISTITHFPEFKSGEVESGREGGREREGGMERGKEGGKNGGKEER